MSLMVSISGIRGIIGESLTPDIVVRYASAFALYCARTHPEGGPIVLGRDGRITGGMIAELVAATLRARGHDVVSLGVCPTPTVQLAVEGEHAIGGIAVTASHNPVQWNGLKFMAATGMFLNREENLAFWALAEDPAPYAPWNGLGALREETGWLDRHIDAVLSLRGLDPDVIRRKKFRIVLDCVNAAGGMIVPRLLERLGCDVIPMNCDVSGIFAHTPEPIPENLADLARRVVDERAQLGIAVDPDVDRLVFITERGEPYGEEYTIASAIQFVLSRPRQGKERPTVVVNLSTTRAVDDIARANGATVIRTPVGEINVAQRMKSAGAAIGGEGSGGVIHPGVHLGRDAIVGIGLVLQLLAESGTTLSGLKQTLPLYAIAKGKIPLGTSSPDEVLARILASHRKEGTVTTDDGLKIDFADSWVHLRKSNTEPILRVIAEARTAEAASAVVEAFRTEILTLLPRT